MFSSTLSLPKGRDRLRGRARDDYSRFPSEPFMAAEVARLGDTKATDLRSQFWTSPLLGGLGPFLPTPQSALIESRRTERSSPRRDRWLVAGRQKSRRTAARPKLRRRRWLFLCGSPSSYTSRRPRTAPP